MSKEKIEWERIYSGLIETVDKNPFMKSDINNGQQIGTKTLSLSPLLLP